MAQLAGRYQVHPSQIQALEEGPHRWRLRRVQQRSDRISDISPADDDKLETLKAFLQRPEVAGEKLLIFSEAETTVDYLHRELNPGS